jgi:hypothetical protein
MNLDLTNQRPPARPSGYPDRPPKPGAGVRRTVVIAALATTIVSFMAWGARAAGPDAAAPATPLPPPAEKTAGPASMSSSAVPEKGNEGTEKSAAPPAEKTEAKPAQPAAEVATEADKTRETMEKIEKARETLDKWVKTRRLISEEQRDWVMGKEMLLSRLEVVKKEIGGLEDKIRGSQASLSKSNDAHADLVVEVDQLKAVSAQLTKTVVGMESEIHRLYKLLPPPIQEKLMPLYKRMPEDQAKTQVPLTERFQNVIGILNEVSKANNEISVNFEVHDLADGKPAEVKVVYVGLAQAYYLSASGEAGVGHPTPDGWKWESSKGIARDVLMTLEILQGKQKAEFVPLPVKMQ